MEDLQTSSGVTVVICCHNGASRLPPTLAHLAAQRVPAGLGVEVVLVDNASTDGTADAARALWPADGPFPLRVVAEPVAGLSHARRTGLAAARFDLISFIDDDNWVGEDWVRLVAQILADRPDVGACGGSAEGVFEADRPSWFPKVQGNFAIGEQYDRSGDVTGQPNALWGAGLTIRRSAWADLEGLGFEFRLSDRSGAGLTSGGDHELCFGLMLAGWRLWYDSRLRLRHYMPRSRVNWPYARKLHRGAGWTSVWLDQYREALGCQARTSWIRAVLRPALTLARNPVRLALCMLRPGEGRVEVIAHELLMGRLAALLQHPRSLARLRHQLHRAAAKIPPGVVG